MLIRSYLPCIVHLASDGSVLHVGGNTGRPPRHPNILYTSAMQPCSQHPQGYHEFVDEFTCLGVTCAVLFFPGMYFLSSSHHGLWLILTVGMVCCFACRERRCFRCGYRL